MTNIKLAEGMTAAITIYLTSEKEGITTTITIGPLSTVMGNLSEPVDLEDLLANNPLKQVADDWRVMTREEIKEFLEEERQEEALRREHRRAELEEDYYDG